MKLTRSFEFKDWENGDIIIIYGAGRYGEIAFHGLEAMGLHADYFADRNVTEVERLGIPIISPDEIVKYENAIVLIASLNYFYEMLSFLQGIGKDEAYDILNLLKVDIDDGLLSEYALDEKNNYRKYFNVVNNNGLDELIMGHCEIVLTERCTLRCKDCANLIQYYKKPCDLDCDSIIQSFNQFLETIDTLLELRLLGGEPFLFSQLDRIIDAFIDNDKIKQITIYTNSTMLPTENVLKSLQRKKVSVHMSDYGKCSRKIKELDEVLTQNKINHYIHHYDKWSDLGALESRDYSDENKEKMFGMCFMSKCYTFYRGKLYVCPRAAHGERLGAFHNKENEYIDFNSNEGIMERKNKLKKLLEETKYIEACNYCNGSMHCSTEIPAAIQVNNH